jgi:hypothetical protein
VRSLRSRTYYGPSVPSGHGFARELEYIQLGATLTQRVGREGEWGCSIRASLALAMYVPRGLYRPTAVCGACETPITPRSSQRHRDPLPLEL